MKPQGLLLCPQDYAAGPYAVPDESRPHRNNLFL
jgi:hypothetical protein